MTPPKTLKPTGTASERVSSTARPALRDEAAGRWLLEFAETDLYKLSPGQWIVLYEKTSAFAQRDIPLGDWHGFFRFDASGEISATPETANTLIRWQGWLRDGLGLLRDDQTWRITVAVTFSHINRSGHGLTFTAVPNAADVFDDLKMRTHDVLARFGPRLRFCQRTDCRKAFIATRRQTFCSPGCSQKLRTARYRAAQSKRRQRSTSGQRRRSPR